MVEELSSRVNRAPFAKRVQVALMLEDKSYQDLAIDVSAKLNREKPFGRNYIYQVINGRAGNGHSSTEVTTAVRELLNV